MKSFNPSSVAALWVAILPLTNGQSCAWETVPCTNINLTNAAINPATRWATADVDDAWTAVVEAWTNQTTVPGDINLTFTETVSNFFHGPDQWDCQNIGDAPCSNVVECSSTDVPAGWLILNSFSSLHQIHEGIYNALQNALTDMMPEMGTFASTFSPQLSDNNDMIDDILYTLAAVVGLGSAFSWNVVIKEAAIFANDNYRGFYKDVFNAAVSFAINIAKTNLPGAASALATQNTLEAALGSLVSSWQGVETSLVENLFSGDSSSIGNLTSLIQQGIMTQVPNDIDMKNVTAEAQKILYGSMIPVAWSLAPAGLHPFILRTDEPCSSTAQGNLSYYMSDDVAAQTHVCYDGYTFYVLNAVLDSTAGTASRREIVNVGALDHIQFQSLPGGTFDTLSGGKFGGVRLDDIVISSYQGWQLNGNTNGYQMPEMSMYIDGNGTEGDFIFQNGIQTPGFFNLTICTSLATTLKTIDSVTPSSADPYWPCPREESTNIHVNEGCISVNGSPLCHPDTYNVAYQSPTESSATIYAQFNGDDKTSENVTPGCVMQALWPADYGDIYFGDDNCLYDSSGNNINNLCCILPATEQVRNPYA